MESQENIKRYLIRFMQKAVRELQKEYVTNRDIIPSSDLTNSLCYGLEAVFHHGLTSATAEKLPSSNFWPVICKHIHKSCLQDVNSSSQIKTDIGRCRAWIRLALNGCELESYLRLIVEDAELLRQHYEPWSFIRDAECTDLLMSSIRGLECVRFHLGHNSTVLNEWSNVSLSLAGLLGSSLQSNAGLSPLDSNGSHSFDDYELSPDDREEVQLMFRFQSAQSLPKDDPFESGERRESLTTTQEDSGIPSDHESILTDCGGIFKMDDCDSFHRQGSEPSPGSGDSVYHSQRSQSVTEHVVGSDKPQMTDEMRDLRFDRIVRENLERYPLDYDKICLQKQEKFLIRKNALKQDTDVGISFSNQPAEQQHCRNNLMKSPSRSVVLEKDGSIAEPDAFWRTVNEDHWSDADGGQASASIQGNLLPNDSWVGPEIVSDLLPTSSFRAHQNDRVRNELEASYGTILADYQKSMPHQFKMVTAEDASNLFLSDDKDGSTCSESVSKKPLPSPKCIGSKIDEDWVVIEDTDCPFTSEPCHADPSNEPLLSLVTQRLKEKTIHDQNYKCWRCSETIEEKGRQCKFDGHWYCTQCHWKETSFIPSRIVYDWDFRKFRVSVENMKFLRKINDWPLLNVRELNPGLYTVSEELNLVRDLRRQSYYLAGYMFHCTSAYAVKYWRAMNARLYYFSHIDNYSIQDLVNVHSGSFRKALKKINSSAVKHIYQCSQCRVKGFYCEICRDHEVIFPFDLKKTTVCDTCKNTYHESCKSSLDLDCPKCNRIAARKMSAPVDPIDLVMFNHPADVITVRL